MSSIYKKRKKSPIPDNAEILKSKNIVEWINGRGKKQKAELSEDGKSMIIESSVWYARYLDHNDIEKHVSTRCRDKQSAQKVLADLVADVDKIRSGIKSPKEANAARHVKQPLTGHIKIYIEYLANKTTRGRKTSPVHVANVKRQLKRLAKDCGFCWINDISKTKISKWMNEQASEDEMSGRTINTYRAALMAFVRWLVAEDKLVVNPLEELYTADEMEKKRKRRALTGEEIAKVLEVARTRPLQDAMTIRHGKRKGQMTAKIRTTTRKRLIALGHERSLMYKTMIYAGLRKNELATLTVDDLNLDANTPFVRLKAKNSKNALADEIPLRTDLAAELRGWISRKLPGTKVFKVPQDLRNILYRDLKKAGVKRVDDQGRQIDVHALRHTCGTQLAKAGVSPQVASKIMRHSSINMTMKHYTHLALVDTGRAVEMLPNFQNFPHANEVVRTGTDDIVMPKDQISVNEKGPEIRPELQSSNAIFGTNCQSEENTSKQNDPKHFIQPLDNKRVGIGCHQNDKCPGLESNQHNPKVTSPSS